MIKKTKNGYKVVSKRTHRNMGTYSTKVAAKKRIRQIEYFKRKGGN